MKRVSPYVELACALVAGALWYAQGGAMWYAGAFPGPWPLLLLALMWGLYWWRAGFSFRPSPLDLLLGLFVLSAFVATQLAYDPGPAWAKFWLVMGAWGIHYAMAHQPDLERAYGALAAWGLFPLLLIGYFLLTNDWEASAVKVPALTELGRRLSGALPALAGHGVHPNIAGGMLAVVVPAYVPLIVLPRLEDGPQLPGWARCGLPAAWGGLLAFALLGLALTVSRGAWLATAGVGALWALWRFLGGRLPWRGRLATVALVVGAGGVGALLAAYAVLRWGLPGAGALANRLSLYENAALLARDVPFTGVGLGAYQMNLSIYTLLIHVGFIGHSHNLFVDLLVEQGVGGLAAFAGLVAAALALGLRARRGASPARGWLIEAGLASLGILLAHGLVDDVLYGSRGLLLLFLPTGLVAMSRKGLSHEATRISRSKGRVLWGIAAAVGVGLVLLGALFWRPLVAAWHANLGAVEQARVELGAYEPLVTPGFIVDSIRREEELSGAVGRFERALELDPANVTARQRLASVRLSRGEYDAALAHLELLWEAGARDDVTRMLYGDALVAHGRVEEAAEVVEGLPWALSRLQGQAWARYSRGEDWQRVAYAWRAAAALGDEGALRKAEEAERKAAGGE